MTLNPLYHNFPYLPPHSFQARGLPFAWKDSPSFMQIDSSIIHTWSWDCFEICAICDPMIDPCQERWILLSCKKIYPGSIHSFLAITGQLRDHPISKVSSLKNLSFVKSSKRDDDRRQECFYRRPSKCARRDDLKTWSHNLIATVGEHLVGQTIPLVRCGDLQLVGWWRLDFRKSIALACN